MRHFREDEAQLKVVMCRKWGSAQGGGEALHTSIGPEIAPESRLSIDRCYPKYGTIRNFIIFLERRLYDAAIAVIPSAVVM